MPAPSKYTVPTLPDDLTEIAPYVAVRGVHESTIRKYIREGRLPAWKIGGSARGGRLLFSAAEADALVFVPVQPRSATATA